MFLAVPAVACDGHKGGTTEASAIKASSTKSGCTAAEKAACAAMGKTCAKDTKAATTTASSEGKTCTKGSAKTADASLPNGHPVVSIADAQKCAKSTTAFLNVNKMTCNGCVAHVTKTLGSMDGTCAVDVNLDKASATVVFHADKVDADKMIGAISKAGYAATLASVEEIDKDALAACKERCANVSCSGKKDDKTSEI
jgi:copper ion binding protein